MRNRKRINKKKIVSSEIVIFIKTGIFFLLPLISLFLYLELNLPRIYDPYRVKSSQFLENIDKIEILVLGSSESAIAINPILLKSKGFNMADSAQSLYYDNRIINQYLDEMVSLKTVIISVSYLSLEYNLSKSPASVLGYYYDRYYHIPQEEKIDYFDLRKYSLTALYGGEQSILYAVDGFAISPDEIVMEGGYKVKNKFNQNQMSLISDEGGRRAVAYHHSMMSQSNILTNLHYLEEIISKLQQKKIISVIITTPVCKTYSSNIDHSRYQVMQDNLKVISQRFNIKYFNYFNDQRFGIEDYADNDHLNLQGAEKFTKIVNEEVLLDN